MTDHHAIADQGDDLLDLARSADPVSEAQIPAPNETLFQEIVSTPRRSRKQQHHRLRQRRRSLVVLGAIAVIAGGTGVAFGSDLLLGGGEGGSAAMDAAAVSGVSNLQTVVASPAGHASVIKGVKDAEPSASVDPAIVKGVKAAEIGDALFTITVGGASGPFDSLVEQLAAKNIVASSGAGGMRSSVDWVAAAGVVSDRVAKVVILGKDGALEKVELTSGAFAVDIDPSFRTSAIVAYDNEGNEVGRVPFPESRAPGIK